MWCWQTRSPASSLISKAIRTVCRAKFRLVWSRGLDQPRRTRWLLHDSNARMRRFLFVIARPPPRSFVEQEKKTKRLLGAVALAHAFSCVGLRGVGHAGPMSISTASPGIHFERVLAAAAVRTPHRSSRGSASARINLTDRGIAPACRGALWRLLTESTLSNESDARCVRTAPCRPPLPTKPIDHAKKRRAFCGSEADVFHGSIASCQLCLRGISKSASSPAKPQPFAIASRHSPLDARSARRRRRVLLILLESAIQRVNAI